MDCEVVYEIARYDVHTDTEVLIERVQLVRSDDALWRRVDYGNEVECPEDDILAAINADPELGEIRADQVTRITGAPDVLAALPFVLRVPGHRDDVDRVLWSESLAGQHLTQDWVVQPGLHRVLYVNGARWAAWSTNEGGRMLPENWPTIRLAPRWASLSFSEGGGMTSGWDQAVIGLITPEVIGAALLLDPGLDGKNEHILLWPRSNGHVDEAEIFADWLLDGGLAAHYMRGQEHLQAMLVQLFVEAALNDCNGVVLPGSRLAAASGAEPGFGDLDSSEWTLSLDMTTDSSKRSLTSSPDVRSGSATS